MAAKDTARQTATSREEGKNRQKVRGMIVRGLSVTNGYDALLRRTNLNVLSGSTVLAKTTNSYDAAGRLAIISDGANAAAYSYLANSPWVDHVVFRHSGTAVMTNQNSYDFDNRLTGSLSSVASGAGGDLSFSCQYNPASQRPKATLGDDSYWPRTSRTTW